jgi:hypothetical protein
MSTTSTITLVLVTEVGGGVVSGTLIRNVDYGAWGEQMVAPVMGARPVETLVKGRERRKVYLPIVALHW